MLDRKKSLLEIFALTALILFLAIIYIRPLNGYLTGFGDNATYALLGKSIAQGRGYRSIWLPGEPPHYHFPFFFPLLLSPIILLAGLNFLWMKGMVVFFALFSVCLTFIFYRSSLGPAWALAIALLVGLCPQFFWFAHQIFAEMPYLAFSLLALICMERYIRDDRWLKSSGFAAGVFATFAYLTHKSGILLLATFFIYLLLKKKSEGLKERLAKTFIFVAASGLLFFLWSLRDFFHSGKLLADTHFAQFLMGDPYTGHLGRASLQDIIGRIIPNLRAYSLDIASFVYMTRAYHIPGVLALLTLAGFIYAFIKKRTCAEIYVLLYIALLSVWYVHSGRHLVPLIPFIIYYFLLIIREVCFLPGKLFRGLRAKPGKLAYILLAIFILLMVNSSAPVVKYYARDELDRKTHFNAQRQAEQEFLQLSEFVKDQVPAGSIVVSRKPTHLYVFSGRQGVWFPYTANKERVLQAIYRVKADFLLADGFSPQTDLYLWPVIEENPDLFVPVYQGRYGAVFKVLYPEKKRSPDAKSTYYRHHRTGRLLSG